MANILSSLATLANDYTVFNKDQVLSDEQLNSLSKYFDARSLLVIGFSKLVLVWFVVVILKCRGVQLL